MTAARLLAALAEASLVLAALAAVAAAMTRRTTPGAAAGAHRVWLTAVGLGIPLVVLEIVVAPIVVVAPLSIGAWSFAVGGEPTWLRAIAIVYAGVAGVWLLRVAIGVVRVARLASASEPVPYARLAGRSAGVRAAAADLALAESAELSVPVTVGVRRPIVLLPRGWEGWSDAALEAIVRHEQAHVARRDYLWTLVAAATEACLWFHPAIWLASRRLRWFAELASDHIAAQSLGADAYAAELLRLAAGWIRGTRIRYGVTVGADSSVPHRIRVLIAHARPEGLGARGLCRLALVMALAALASAAVRVAPSTGGSRGVFDDLVGHGSAHRARHHATHQPGRRF